MCFSLNLKLSSGKYSTIITKKPDFNTAHDLFLKHVVTQHTKFQQTLNQVWPNVLGGIRDCLSTGGYSAIDVTVSSQCCGTAVQSRKCGAWKNVQGIWGARIKWSAGHNLATPVLNCGYLR